MGSDERPPQEPGGPPEPTAAAAGSPPLDPDDSLAQAVVEWLNQPSPRAARRYLEHRPDFQGQAVDGILRALMGEYASDADLLEELIDHRELLDDISRRSAALALQQEDPTGAGTGAEGAGVEAAWSAAVRETYVQTFGGGALDVPEWVETAEACELALDHAEGHSDASVEGATERIQIWREALTRGEVEPALPMVVRAFLHWRMWDVLDDAVAAAGPFTDRSALQEESLGHLKAALAIYTRQRYPRQWATMQNNLGISYAGRLAGDRRVNQDRAIAHYRAALTVRTRTALPFEWAMAQNNLAVAYDQRLAGDRRVNQERAIAHYRAALEVFTRERYPYRWATIRQNLGALYVTRLTGNDGINVEHAIRAYRDALAVFTRSDYRAEWARARAGLGNAFQDRTKGSRTKNLRQAIACFEDAVTVRTRERHPLLWADAQESLGNAHRELADVRGGDMRPALAHFRAALRVYSRAAYPSEWARVVNGLGLAWMDASAGNRARNLARAVACLAAALRVRPTDIAPHSYRRMALNLAEAEAARGRWGAAHAAYAEASIVEEALFAASVTVTSKDTALRESREAAVRDAYALTRLGRYEEALAAVERGRARVLAETRLQAEVDPRRIADPAMRRRYLAAVAALRRARRDAEAEEMAGEVDETDVTVPPVSATRDALFSAAERYQRAQEGLAGVFAEIRSSGELPDFLRDAVDRDLFLGAAPAHASSPARTATTCHAFVYVLATPWGGTALGAFVRRDTAAYGPSAPDAPFAALHIASRDLPGVTVERIEDLLEVTVGDDSTAIVGGFTWAQEYVGLDLLMDVGMPPNDEADEDLADDSNAVTGDGGKDGEVIPAHAQRPVSDRSLAEHCAHLEHTCAEAGVPSALLEAARTMLADPAAGRLAALPLRDLTADQHTQLRRTLGNAFLRAELHRCLPVLAEIVVRPLVSFLHDEGATAATLIPCGALGAFPLTTIPQDVIAADGGSTVFAATDTGTLAERFAAACAPSVRALMAAPMEGPSPFVATARSGVWALGNPRRAGSRSRLIWGDVEAEILAILGGNLDHAAVQDRATRAWAFEAFGRSRVLALACHGEFDYRDALRSRLLLANGETVTLGEILRGGGRLRGMRLVILSTCQGGIQQVRGARDEARSLAVGMLQAGARAVLAALWPVDDRATYLLVARFALEWFPQISTKAPAAALARAQHWLRTVTYDDLTRWDPFRHQVEPRSGEVQTELTPHELRGAPTARGAAWDQNRQISPWLSAATDDIRWRAARHVERGEGDLRPYTDPIYWSAFQITGM